MKEWFNEFGDVQIGGGRTLHETVEGEFGNTAVYVSTTGAPPENIRVTLEQSTQRPDEILPELAMSLAGQVLRVRRAVKREADFPRSTDRDSMFFGHLVVAGTSYDITAVSEDQSFVYLTLAISVQP